MGRRRSALSLFALIAAVVLAGTAVAWACTSAGGPFINDLFDQRAAAGATIDVRGGGWLASTPVELTLRPGRSTSDAATGRVVLGAAVTDSSGGLAAPVTVPPVAAPGFYYIGATQGPTTRFTPLQLVAPAASSPPARAAGEPAGEWPGLGAAGVSEGLTDVPARDGAAGSFVPLAVAATAGLALLALAGTAATHRSRTRASDRP